ncbi:MAG: hypothetical protein JWM64_392 [Frankiales bacterium]|nr:hypothetical protein [Frankiales bacterium]
MQTDGSDVERDGDERDQDALDQARLRATLNRYLAARSAARRSPDADPAAMVAARLDLVRLLQTAGWEPPPSVQAALLADAHAQQASGRRSA